MNTQIERTPKTMDRISGLDSIRFICALWVFFNHGSAPPIPNPFADGSFAFAAFRSFFCHLWSGPPAVIVFFIISGFCIHFPFAASVKQPQLKEFYSRRFLRLLIPVAVVIPLSAFAGAELNLFELSVLWSLLAELIYYLCYPLLRAIHLRLGSWRGMVLAAFVVGFAVAATNPSAIQYPSFGPALNWLLGLPCWLLGCQIAEAVRARTHPPVSTRSIWIWRVAVCGSASACSFIASHGGIGFPWTLNLFALLAALWLRREIALRQHVAPIAIFEWAGLWSYSLYLVHFPAHVLFSALFAFPPGNTVEWVVRWGLKVFFVFSLSYVFYLLIERPSHIMAQRVAQQFRRPTNAISSHNSV